MVDCAAGKEPVCRAGPRAPGGALVGARGPVYTALPMIAPRLSLPLVALVAVAGCKKEPPPQPPQPVVEAPKPEQEASPAPACDYLVLVDAGSTGTRAYTFKITPGEGGTLPTIAQVSAHKAEGGIASFKAEPAKAGAQVAELLKQEGGALATIPAACHGKTPTAVMATGGMRLLEGESGGDAAAKGIYDAITASIKETGLDARFAGTISGQQEAVYAWLSTNYALGKLAGDGATDGALDLGGVSAQIAFVPAEAGDAPTIAVKLGGKTFNLYAQSYAGYGVEYARPHLNYDACFPKGVGKGTGNYKACATKLDASLKPASCGGARCGLATPGDAKAAGTLQPALPAGAKFHTFGVYTKVAGFFTLPETATPAALAEAAGGKNGKGGYCGTPIKQSVTQHQGVDARVLENECFDAAWAGSLLKGFGFAADTDALVWADKLGEFDASWALGAALCSVTGCLSAK